MSDQCSCKVSGWYRGERREYYTSRKEGGRREETDKREEQMRKIGGDMEWVQQGR